MNAYAKTADTYLTQRIQAASPEQQAALIMEAGQLHLGKAVQAMTRNDMASATSSLIRVSEVIVEAGLRLNREDGGELVQSLDSLYSHWTREIMEASAARDTNRLSAVARAMGEIRQAWEQYHEKKNGTVQLATFQFGDRVV